MLSVTPILFTGINLTLTPVIITGVIAAGGLTCVSVGFFRLSKDALLIKVEQIKAACHLGYKSCFFRKLSKKGEWEIVKEKIFEPKEVYNSLKR